MAAQGAHILIERLSTRDIVLAYTDGSSKFDPSKGYIVGYGIFFIEYSLNLWSQSTKKKTKLGMGFSLKASCNRLTMYHHC